MLERICMNNKITCKDIVNRLEEHHMAYDIVTLENGFQIIVTEYGGRIFGPFDKDGISVLWVNEVFSDCSKFNDFMEKEEWNLGGDRLWIAPELEFFCTEPSKFDETYTVQRNMDPGYYRIEMMDEGVCLQNEAEVEILGDGNTKMYSCERRISSAKNPLEYVSSIDKDKVKYCGYVQDILLKDKKKNQKMYLEPWILTQINPGGKVIVPYLGTFDFVDYYEPVDETCQKIFDGYAELNITGKRKYKTAYRSANTFGRMGYVNRTPGGDWYLMIRNYYNDPSIPYCSEPWKNLGDKGCSMYFYNDDGSTGGFAEFENSCATIGMDANRDCSYSTTSLWFFMGEKEELEKIIKVLLGVSYKICE